MREREQPFGAECFRRGREAVMIPDVINHEVDFGLHWQDGTRRVEGKWCAADTVVRRPPGCESDAQRRSSNGSL